MKLPKSKGMVIDGVAASQCIDSSGEVIDIAGIDCARFDEAGGILLNWEHEPGEKGADTIVGRLIYLKKIYKESDCENDRQRLFWNKCRQTPFVYVVARLFDGSGHEKARAIAAIIRDNKAHDEPLACRFSIEGTTAEREGNKLLSSVFRRLAVTVSPCNKTANTDLLEDNDPEWGEMKKYESSNPLLKKVGGSVRIEYDPVLEFEDSEETDHERSITKLLVAAKLFQNMRKAIGATDPGVKSLEPSEVAGLAQHPEAERLANLPKEQFAAEAAKGISLPMYRGHMAGNDPGPQWYASHPATAHGYANKGPGSKVKHRVLTMKNPYVASSMEMINSTSGTVDRLRAAGHDGIVTQWSGGIHWPGKPKPNKEIWAVAFDNPDPVAKSIDAGPDTLTQGAALEKEDEDLARKAVDLLKTFDQPFTREGFAAFTKAQLPEVSDAFVEHFTDIAENLHLKKGNLDYKPLGPSLRKYINVMESNLIQLRKSVREAMAGTGVSMPEIRALKLRINGKEHPAGRFMIYNGKVDHLEDYHGILAAMLPEGPISVKALTGLHGLQYNPDFSVHAEDHQVPMEQVGPTAPPEVTVQQQELPAPPAVFDYQRPGMFRPHVIEFGANGASIDGSKLTDSELELILDNTSRGVGTLRYRNQVMAKSENLSKAVAPDEPDDLEDAINHIRQLEAQGIVRPGTSKTMTKATMEDSMVDGVGSKYAWKKFHAKQKPGVYLSMDGNDFKSINETHGHGVGDDAITAMGGALRSAAEKTGMGKLFRPGGDEFVAHFPTHQDATTFMRHAREHLDQLPPIQGTHKLSLSFGLGNDYHTADKVALPKAKAFKVDKITGGRMFPEGQTPHFAHSEVPGAEGPVALHHDMAPAGTIPAPKPVTPAAPEGMQKAEPGQLQPLRPHANIASDPGYMYHATNEWRAHDIAQQGLQVHRPHEFTDQETWPDGTTEKRNYHSPNAGVVHSFAPDEGHPVILRTHSSKHPFQKERTTGDVYSKKPIPAQHMEIGMADGSWIPLSNWSSRST